MAITNLQEKIKLAKKNGYTDEQIQNYLASKGMNVGELPQTQDQAPSLGQQYTMAVSDAAKAGVEKIQSGLNDAATKGTEDIIGGTIGAAAKVGAGVGETISSPLTPLLSPIGKAIGYVTDKIAGNKAVQDFAVSDAGKATAQGAEIIGNLSTVAGLGAGSVVAPKALTGVGRGIDSGVKSTAGAVSGVVGTGVRGIQEAISSALDPVAIMQRVARVNKTKQAKFEAMAGQPIGKYLVDRGIYGNTEQITTQLFEQFQASKAAADKGIASLEGKFKYKPVDTAIRALSLREYRVSTPGAKSRDFDKVRELSRKFNDGGLTQAEINEVKRLLERNLKVDYIKTQKPEEVAKVTNLDTAIRELQRAEAEKQGFTNLRDINKETQMAKQLLDDLGQEASGVAGNNAVSLSDWILISGLDPASISAFLVKKGASSKSIQSAVAKRLAPEPTIGKPFPIYDRTPNPIETYSEWIKSIEGRTSKKTQ